jgi:hypothetical protein
MKNEKKVTHRPTLKPKYREIQTLRFRALMATGHNNFEGLLLAICRTRLRKTVLNDYFPSPNVEPCSSKLRSSDKSPCTYPPSSSSSSKVVQVNTHNMKLLSAVLFKVATDLEILHNRGSRGSNRGLVAKINVTKIATNLS